MYFMSPRPSGDSLLRTGSNSLANGGRVFPMRIVIGHNNNICVAGSDLTHDGALALVTFTGSTEHDNDSALTGAVHRL